MSKSNISVGNQGWIDRINAKWRMSATAIIETGQLLIECKKTLNHGDWGGMFATGKLDFDQAVAQRLMKIARDPRLSNPAHVQLLPKHWSTLYELTRLADDEFETALNEGAITKQTQRSEVKRLRGPKPKVTDAEYRDVIESPEARPGPAVSDRQPADDVGIDADEGAPHGDAKAEIGVVTHPERAAVTDPKPKPPEAHWNADDGAGSFSETNARLPEGADPRHSGPEMQSQANPAGDTGGAGGSPAFNVIAALRQTVVGRHMSDDNLTLLAGAAMKVIEEEPRPLKFIPAHQVAYPPREGMVAYWVDPNDPVSALVLAVALLNRIRKEITAARAGALWPSDTPMLSDDFDELSFWLDDAAAAFRARYKHGSDAALQTAE